MATRILCDRCAELQQKGSFMYKLLGPYATAEGPYVATADPCKTPQDLCARCKEEFDTWWRTGVRPTVRET